MFRTEFIFMGDEAPSGERQTAVYADILRRTPGPVVMRTIEAGGDKSIPYLTVDHEENPNLGWQGLRMCLDMEDFFLTQLRAMIRASSEGELWIMFPFVSALWELRRCRELITKAHLELEAQGAQPGNYKVGIMVEVPSAALLADEYLRDFDFCSIGTNDLIQYDRLRRILVHFVPDFELMPGTKSSKPAAPTAQDPFEQAQPAETSGG